MGFGFVAGSEKPVIVRFVTEGGPSEDKLLPGDQILMVNGEDVARAPRDHVIQLVRSCTDTVTLTVTQPPLDNSARKSALLSAAKKQRLRSNPSRVRFAESVHINGSTSSSPSQISSSESTTPFMPNVLKVFLENGQTKSFKYDASTTVEDVLQSLHAKLGIKCQDNFALVVEHVKSLKRNKLTILDPRETLSAIAARPGAQHLRCLYRITFVPRDIYDLLKKDSVAFEYLYLQCCNDVVNERFSPELKYDVALRIAALQIQQHAVSTNMTGKISVKAIERECGLERFVPASLVGSMKRKELRKLLSHFLKIHASMTPTGQKQLSALQAKLHYLKIISDLPSYGAKCFSSNMVESNTETVILISPKFGISQIAGLGSAVPEAVCDIEQVTSVKVTKEDDVSRKVEIFLKDPERENLLLNLEERDAEELVLVLNGYYRLLTEKTLPVVSLRDHHLSEQAPPYHCRHRVEATNWNYITSDSEAGNSVPLERIVDLSLIPPYQPPPEGYKIPNGHVPGVHDTDESGVYVNSRRAHNFDSNMNKMNSVYENANGGLENELDAQPSLTVGPRDGASQVSAIGSEKPFPHSGNIQPFREKLFFSSSYNEARNEEVIKRVVDVNQVIEDAENYLSDADGENTDIDSVRSEHYGRLKHSDSLLLLTQGQKLVKNGEVVESEERSGSDTDSQSTPNTSPAHKPVSQCPVPALKTSGSSFGLHSPDNLPFMMQKRENNIKDLIRQLEDNSGLPYTFAEGTLYLDPDIIDLTMIPPPITPDEDGAKLLPSQLSTPPTPFADRETLDNELRALERDFGDLRSLDASRWSNMGTLQSCSDASVASDSEDSSSVSSLNTSHISLDGGSPGESLNGFSCLGKNGNGSPGFTLAALRQLGINIGEGEDIDSFIANLTIPPPPEGSTDLQSYAESRKIGGDYDITAFIIPPPPSSDGSDNRSSDIIRRLYEAKEGISRVVGTESEPAEKDNDVGEVRVVSEQVQKHSLPAGKVASLQRHFEGRSKSEMNTQKCSSVSTSVDNRQLLLRLSKEKLSPASDSSGYDSLRSNASNIPTDLDHRLAQALEENDKIFKSLDKSGRVRPSKEKDRINEFPVTVASRVRSFSHSSSSPSSSSANCVPRPSTLHRIKPIHNTFRDKNAVDDIPPPPPPRTPVTKTGTLASAKTSSFISKAQSSAHGKISGLSKSASQGDIARTTIDTIITSNKANKPSVSTEDLRVSYISPGSPSKHSAASSNESLNSSSSVITVKSASSKSLNSEPEPPELPPRNGTNTSIKPPLPRSSSQDNSRSPHLTKGIRSPSPAPKIVMATAAECLEKPPAIPSRLRKPQLSPSPTNSLSRHQNSNTLIQKKHPPHRPVSSSLKKSPAPEPNNSPSSVVPQATKLPAKNLDDSRPHVPSKKSQSNPRDKSSSSPSLNGSPAKSGPLQESTVAFKNAVNNESAPLLTSSPKLMHKPELMLEKMTLDETEDCHDSGSFEQDSLEELEDMESMGGKSKAAYKKCSAVVSESSKCLNELIAECTEAEMEKTCESKNETLFLKVRECLTSESRQFVTASKLFVKSATETEDVLLDCLSKCITVLQKMVSLTQEMVSATNTPAQTKKIVTGVRDVNQSFLVTVRAALVASGRGMDHPSMNVLMSQATNLAGVLTQLMRTLKVISP